MRKLVGRKKVVLPISKEDFYNNIYGSLKEYLGNAISTHNSNVSDIKYLHKVYLGMQDIYYEKTRYDSSSINNKNVENHINKIVNFKVGFMYGNPLDYSIVKAINTDDMTIFNSYMIDSNKASLDIEKAQDLYEFGVAYQLVLPKRQEQIEDIDTNSPFLLSNLPVESTCVVYSSDVISEELFGLVITKRIGKNGMSENIYNVYMPNRRILLNSDYNVISDDLQAYDFIPIIEYTCNKTRMGIIELGLSMQNLINKINSSEMDDIEENINSFIVFLNQRVDDDFKKNLKELKASRVIALNTNNVQAPADLKAFSTSLNLDYVNAFYERTVKALYDITATPQSSGNVTSGGDTGQARLLGNGWESAQNQAQLEQTYLLQYERKLCRYILKICKQNPNCKIDEINASDIDIKFNINMSNNLLIKSESLKLLNDSLLPEKVILKICGLTSDVDGVGNEWIANKQKAQQESQVQEENTVREN